MVFVTFFEIHDGGGLKMGFNRNCIFFIELQIQIHCLEIAACGIFLVKGVYQLRCPDT